MFSRIYVFRSTSPELKENTKNTQTKSQKIASGITHVKEAHLTDQTDQRSPGTNIPTSGPTRQCTKERRWPEVARWGRPNQGFGRTPPEGRLGALWREDHSDSPEGGCECFHVYLGGNRPQGAIKGASLHTLNAHHLKASLSHSLVT